MLAVCRQILRSIPSGPRRRPNAPLTIPLREWRDWIGRSPRIGRPADHQAALRDLLSALNLDSGDVRWQVPLGDTPDSALTHELRITPASARDSGSRWRCPPVGGWSSLRVEHPHPYAVDSRDGTIKWSAELGAIGYRNPMTYRASNGVQFVVVATGLRNRATLQAFALPRRLGWWARD